MYEGDCQRAKSESLCQLKLQRSRSSLCGVQRHHLSSVQKFGWRLQTFRKAISSVSKRWSIINAELSGLNDFMYRINCALVRPLEIFQLLGIALVDNKDRLRIINFSNQFDRTPGALQKGVEENECRNAFVFHSVTKRHRLSFGGRRRG